MLTPAWILDVFAAIMLVVAAVSAARLIAARPWRPGAFVTDIDVSHLLMGIAMAGMLAPGLRSLPDDGWAVVFCVLTAWFGYRVVLDYRDSGARALAVGHCGPHLVHSAAMVYMVVAISADGSDMAGMGGMAGMAGMNMAAMTALRVPTLAYVFALVLIGYTIWDLDVLSSLWRPSPTAAAAGPASPGLVTASSVVVDPRAAALSGLGSQGTVVGCRIAMGVTMALLLVLMI